MSAVEYVISCHGGCPDENKLFNIPSNVSLYFYAKPNQQCRTLTYNIPYNEIKKSIEHNLNIYDSYHRYDNVIDYILEFTDRELDGVFKIQKEEHIKISNFNQSKTNLSNIITYIRKNENRNNDIIIYAIFCRGSEQCEDEIILKEKIINNIHFFDENHDDFNFENSDFTNINIENENNNEENDEDFINFLNDVDWQTLNNFNLKILDNDEKNNNEKKDQYPPHSENEEQSNKKNKIDGGKKSKKNKKILFKKNNKFFTKKHKKSHTKKHKKIFKKMFKKNKK